MEERPKKKYNPYVNALKGVACIIVFFLHCPLPGILGDGIIYGLRFSVPIFFLISGYYSYYKSKEWILKKAKYILKLLLFSEIFYGVWTYIDQCVIHNQTFEKVFVVKFQNMHLIKTVFFGSVFNGTLWYLYAMFWTWIILYLLKKHNVVRKCYVLIPVILFVQVFGRLYVQNVYDITQYVYLFRSVILFGLPFSLLGLWIADNQVLLLEKIDKKKNVLIIVSGFLTIVAEFILYGQYMDTHTSTIIIAFGLFLYAIQKQKEPPKFIRIFEYIGAKWSMWIYITHMFVISVVELIFEFGFTKNIILFQFAMPILGCVLTCIISEVLARITRIKLER